VKVAQGVTRWRVDRRDGLRMPSGQHEWPSVGFPPEKGPGRQIYFCFLALGPWQCWLRALGSWAISDPR
jgi:hypothetical protein